VATEINPKPTQAKLDALREAVLNPSTPLPPVESLHQMFLAWVDRFTGWHMRILVFFDDPRGWFEKRGRPFPAFMFSSPSSVLTEAYPELKNQQSFYDMIAKDLWNNGLMYTDGLHGTMSAGGAGDSRTSDIGKQFLRFITESKPAK
jgi:hypothetical protein